MPKSAGVTGSFGSSSHCSVISVVVLDFLLVFYSDDRYRWNHCRVI